jgi:outer membrane protein assembly factor BamB
MIHRLLPVVLILTLGTAALATDWPQWQGPDRDNVSKETGLLQDWPKGGPKFLWSTDILGTGYSGPAVVGDRVYILGSDGKQDFAIALDANDKGKKVWATPIGPYVQNGYGSGPRGTPTVDGEFLYALGAAGQLHCLRVADGSRVWAVDLVKDLGGGRPNWNFSESPFVDTDQVICTPGGRNGTLAALDKAKGTVIWRSKDLTAGAAYSSVVVTEIGGNRHYVQMTTEGAVGVAAKDGKLLWKEPVAINRTAIVPTPIVQESNVYVTSNYGAGCALLKLSGDGGPVKAEVVYQNKDMDNHHGGVVLVDGLLYGCSGNTNGRPCKWVCQDFNTGKKVWDDLPFQPGSVTYADGRLYCYGQNDGTALLVEVSKAGYKVHGQFTIPRHARRRERPNSIWTHPVVANGKLYLRDQELLFCYDVKANP